MCHLIGLLMILATPPQHAHSDSADGLKSATGSVAQDYQLVDGKWERSEQRGPLGMLGTVRIVKEIDSQRRRERVTRYDSAGKLVVAHEVDFRLERASGPSRLFTFTNLEQVEGPNKGRKSQTSHSYLYHVSSDRFVEVWGLLVSDEDRPIEVIQWRRMKDEPKQTETARENDHVR